MMEPQQPKPTNTMPEAVDTQPPVAPGAGGETPSTDVTFSYHGNDTDLFVLTLKNLLFKMLTLGVYHFWGKTRVRQYIWSQSALNGERLEYTGLVRELVIGYMLAMVLVGPLLGGWNWIMSDPGNFTQPWFGVTVLVFPILVLYLTGIAQFSSRRYMLSRSRWRGIRFALSGSALIFGLKFLALTYLAFLSMGLLSPFTRNWINQHLLNRTWFGSMRFNYNAESFPLFMRWLVFLGISFGSLTVLLVIYLSVLIIAAQFSDIGPEPMLGLFIASFPIFLTLFFPVFLLGMIWYQAGEFRYVAKYLRLGDVAFKADFSTWAFFKLLGINFLLTVFTFGLAFPLVVNRSLRFICEHFQGSGQLDMESITQNLQKRPGMGEGLAEAFDLGGI